MMFRAHFVDKLERDLASACLALETRQYRAAFENDHAEALALGSQGVPFLVFGRAKRSASSSTHSTVPGSSACPNTVGTHADIGLPFLDSPDVPAFDAFVFLVPEYNGGLTGIQKNAIDWVYKEWNGKRAAIVTYNFYDKKSAAEALLPVLGVVQVEPVEPIAGLKIGEEIAPDGAVLDADALRAKIEAACTALVGAPVAA